MKRVQLIPNIALLEGSNLSGLVCKEGSTHAIGCSDGRIHPVGTCVEGFTIIILGVVNAGGHGHAGNLPVCKAECNEEFHSCH